jgi:hypothetical protein
MALLNDAPRSATVRLLEESSFICIDRRAFKLAMASLARNMLKNKRPEKRTESDIMVLIIAIRVLIIAITVLIIAVTREADGERYHGTDNRDKGTDNRDKGTDNRGNARSGRRAISW